MRHRSSLILLCASLALPGCGPVAEDGCAPYRTDDTTGAALTAIIDGRPFVAPAYAGDLPAYYRASDSLLLLSGNSYHDPGVEQVTLAIRPFHGTGAYPMSPLGGPQSAWGFYTCHSFSRLDLGSSGDSGDSVHVTSFDLDPARVTGTFSFRAADGVGGEERVITAGTFAQSVYLDTQAASAASPGRAPFQPPLGTP